MYDLIIKNGKIVSGRGNPWFYCDIAISEGKIVGIGHFDNAQANKTIDAKKMVVSPGFIDGHSHSDLSLLIQPRAEAKVMQGVTTEIIGLDGLSLSPVSENNSSIWRKFIAGVCGNPDIPWNWKSFADQMDALDAVKPSLNVSSYAGLGAIRFHVMGMTDRGATQSEIETMRDIAIIMMEEGARGISSGLIYPPNEYQTTDEIARIAERVPPYGGAYNIHLRSEGDRLFPAMDEAIEIGRRSGIPVIITHFKIMGEKNWGEAERALEKVDEARRQGIEVSIEQYPYTAGSTFLKAIVPPWYHAGGPDALIRTLCENRNAVKKDIYERNDWENFVLATGWDNIRISSVESDANQKFVGKSITEISRLRGTDDPADSALDIIVEEQGAVSMVLFFMDERDVMTIMSHPAVNYITDGILGGSQPHPRVYGSFPRILGRYVREKGILRLEDAIRKMTSLPAEKLQLKSKGVIAEGYDADLVIFDPDTVIDTATYENPRQYPLGIFWVVVNGEVVVEEGKHTGAAPGKTIRTH
ncbi:MAG: D-aminoacylase [Candidatus Latescibacterota bacterium]